VPQSAAGESAREREHPTYCPRAGKVGRVMTVDWGGVGAYGVTAYDGGTGQGV
jgi:hypothetical protein